MVIKKSRIDNFYIRLLFEKAIKEEKAISLKTLRD